MLSRIARLFAEETPKVTRAESLRAVPVVRPKVWAVEGPEGERIVYVPRKSPFRGFLKSWFPQEPAPARYFLDDLGNAVFGRIDGERSVETIVKEFAEEKGLNRREAEAGVVEFLNHLMRRGVIVMVMP